MGVHHAWGRTYKDLYQRYNAMQGYQQRYQNGFDCQGLWVEVEVEKELGFNSKREIEEYGLAEFAERSAESASSSYADVISQQSIRLGQWMHWDDSLLHPHRQQHRAHLALPEDLPREGLALPGRPLDAVVHPLRHRPLPARAGRAPTRTAT